MAHNTLLPASGALVLSRRSERAIASLQARTQVEMAHLGEVAALQTLRVETVACVGRRALHSVALLSQAEASLLALVPLATSRLQAIADLTALGVADVVADTVRLVTR